MQACGLDHDGRVWICKGDWGVRTSGDQQERQINAFCHCHKLDLTNSYFFARTGGISHTLNDITMATNALTTSELAKRTDHACMLLRFNSCLCSQSRRIQTETKQARDGVPQRSFCTHLKQANKKYKSDVSARRVGVTEI